MRIGEPALVLELSVIRRGCEALQFEDARGRLQVPTRSYALEKLAVRVRIDLPDADNKYVGPTAPRLLGDRVPMRSPEPGTLQEVRELRLIRVDDARP